MQVKVVQPGKKKTKDFGAVAVDDKATVAQLKLAFEKATRISRHRQAFKVLDAKTGALKVSSYPLSLPSCPRMSAERPLLMLCLAAQ